MLRLLLFFIPCFLYCEWDELFNGGGDPCIAHHVNVLTGNSQLCTEDTVIQGAVPFSLVRTYSSAGADERILKKTLDLKKINLVWQLEGGWSFLPHLQMIVDPRADGDFKLRVYLKEPTGEMVTYMPFEHDGGFDVIMKPQKKSNQGFGLISGRLNPNNNILYINYKKGTAVVELADGGRRIYKGDPRSVLDAASDKNIFQFERDVRHYLLQEEISPSGQVTSYDYSQLRKIKISKMNPNRTKTYSWAEIKSLNRSPPFIVEITTSDERIIRYEGWSFKGQEYLNFVANGCGIFDDFSYTKTKKGRGASLRLVKSWNNEVLHISYFEPPTVADGEKWTKYPHKAPPHMDKVSCIDCEGTIIATFGYAKGRTDVRDANSILTRYHYDDQLNLIEYFDKAGELNSSQKFIWRKGNLIAKVMMDGDGNPIFSKTFEYDSYGNITNEALYGNFTGERCHTYTLKDNGALIGAEYFGKRYVYDKENHLLILEKENNGIFHEYQYLDGTDLPILKRTYNKKETLLTSTYEYDSDHLLIRETIDDGTIYLEKRYERDPNTAQIIAIEDGLTRVEYAYTQNHQISNEKIIDANGDTSHAIEYKYDRFGNLISKSTPCDQKNLYKYSNCGDLIWKKEVGQPEVYYTYDSCHREISSESAGKRATTTYNKKGLISSKTDPFGNRVEYKYDAFDRCCLTIFPEVLDEDGVPYSPMMECTYDIRGNLIYCKNSKGEVKQCEYNVLSKPILEIFDDGSKALHIYNMQGGLLQSNGQGGSEVVFTRDQFNRVTSKSNSSNKEYWVYSPTNLISYTDETGLTTTYTYDEYGRKIEEDTLGRKTTFTYDALGYINSVTTGGIKRTLENDKEGKLIYEDKGGENQTHYFYDAEGHKNKVYRKTSIGNATDLIEYDEEGRITKHTDPYNAITEYLYEGQTKIIIDPTLNKTIETYDAMGRLSIKKCVGPTGELALIEENFYDRSGNLARKISHIYENGNFIKDAEVFWEYDFRGLVIKEGHKGKITYNEYDPTGRLTKKTFPSGVELNHRYDNEGRLNFLISSDGTINYNYKYGKGPNPTSIFDDNIYGVIYRTYNEFGQILSEINQQKHITKWEYDFFGRKTKIVLPDESIIAYEYDSAHLKKVKRLSKEGLLLYEHTYNEFDTNGHVTTEHLIMNLGEARTLHDHLERPTYFKTNRQTASVTYGKSGLVTSIETTLFGNKNYEYDALNQLKKDGEKEYHFDSIGNLSHVETNAYSELVTKYIYDNNGNPTKKLDDSTEYSYDALNRLREIKESGNTSLQFFYDAYSRLTAKIENGEKTYYLYDDTKEIGTMSAEKEIKELKVLGLGLDEDIGAAVAIELGSKIYAPIHDFHGNIIALLSSTGEIFESYNFDAFGRENPSKASKNPWRFSSKRNEKGLIYFGKRFYDLENGRWLTPDPLGHFESTNVYLYTLNSPLNRLDLFGLNSYQNEKWYFAPRDAAPMHGNIPYKAAPPEMLIIKAAFLQVPNASPVDIIVISGAIHKIRYTPVETILNKANLLDHFHEIVPKEKGVIGLVTTQNGVNTSLDDFKINCKSIVDNIPEQTTLIACHNKSNGTFQDFLRAHSEVNKRTMTLNASLTGHFTGIIANSLNNIQSSTYWLHVPHSEAGVLFNLGYTMLTESQKDLLKNQLIVFAVAPAEPISWQHCFEADNIYSHADRLTGPLGKKFLNNPNYNISYIKCESSRKEFSAYLADHAFTGTTYRNATTDRIKDLRADYGFYNNRRR